MPVTRLSSTSVSIRSECSHRLTPASIAISNCTSFIISGSTGVNDPPMPAGFGKWPPLAGSTALDDAIDELLRQAAHDLFAAAVVKRRDVGELEARAPEVAGLLDQTGMGAAAGSGDGGDRSSSAPAHDNDVEIGRLRCHFHFLIVPMER